MKHIHLEKNQPPIEHNIVAMIEHIIHSHDGALIKSLNSQTMQEKKITEENSSLSVCLL